MDQRRLHGARTVHLRLPAARLDAPGGRRAGEAGRRRRADGLSPRGFLAVHGHAARHASAGGPLAERARPLEGLGPASRRTHPAANRMTTNIMKQRVLVTGSAGYIGCVMVETLQARGHEVVGLDTGFFTSTLPGQTETACPM